MQDHKQLDALITALGDLTYHKIDPDIIYDAICTYCAKAPHERSMDNFILYLEYIDKREIAKRE